jgi:hypothetical protein
MSQGSRYNKLKRKYGKNSTFFCSQESGRKFSGFSFEFVPGGNSQFIIFPPGGKEFEQMDSQSFDSGSQGAEQGRNLMDDDSTVGDYAAFASQLPGKQLNVKNCKSGDVRLRSRNIYFRNNSNALWTVY